MKIEKIKCLISYFKSILKDEECLEDVIVVSRTSEESDYPGSLKSKKKMSKVEVRFEEQDERVYDGYC